MKYFFYAWCVAPSCYLDMLDKLEKLLFWTFGTSPAASLKPSPQHHNVARLYLFCRYHCSRWWSELDELAPLSYSRVPLVILIGYLIFLSPVLDVTKMFMGTIFLPHMARLWNSLFAEYISLYVKWLQVNGVNRHLLYIVVSFYPAFLYLILSYSRYMMDNKLRWPQEGLNCESFR